MIDINFLKEKIGLNDDQANSIYNTIKSNFRRKHILDYSEDEFIEKLDFLKKELGLSYKSSIENYDILAWDLNSDKPYSVKSKIEFYRETLGFSNQLLVKNLYLLMSDCVAEDDENPTSIKAKIKFYQETLGFGKKQFQRIPTLLGLDCVSDNESNPASVKAKIKFYKEVLGFSNAQLQSSPTLLTYDCVSTEKENPTSVKAKIKFYSDTFGFTNETIRKNPLLLFHDCISDDITNPTSIKAKAKFYKETLGLTNKHFQNHAQLFIYDCQPDNPNSIQTKIEKLYEIGLTKEDIQNNTMLLTIPAKDTKIKYALWCTLFPDKSFFKCNYWFKTSHQKVFARFMYFNMELKKSPQIYQLLISEKHFQEYYGAESDDLMKRYPFDEKIADEIFKTYNELEINPPLQKD